MRRISRRRREIAQPLRQLLAQGWLRAYFTQRFRSETHQVRHMGQRIGNAFDAHSNRFQLIFEFTHACRLSPVAYLYLLNTLWFKNTSASSLPKNTSRTSLSILSSRRNCSIARDATTAASLIG